MIDPPTPSEQEWTESDRQWFERVRSLEAKVAELDSIMPCGHRRRFESIIEGGHSAVCQMCKVAEQAATIEQLTSRLNAPELLSFRDGVILEAAHQRERWGSSHDDGKKPADWFWLIGYLAGKALAAHIADNSEKALHHTISTAAALANWHAAILGKTDMRPGIMEPIIDRTVEGKPWP
jgi:hypothetical protein